MADDAPKMGRPSGFTQDIADEFCSRIAQGRSVRSVCAADDMPCMKTIFSWLARREDFAQQYARAKEASADALADEMLDIADDGTNDWMEIHDKDGACVGYKLNGEATARSRLRVETRKWLAGKLKPKKYGEKVDVNHGVQPDNPIVSLMDSVSGKVLRPGAVVPDDETTDE